MTKVTDRIGIYPEEFNRHDGTFELWFSIIDKKDGNLYTIVRPFLVQKVLNKNLHLN